MVVRPNWFLVVKVAYVALYATAILQAIGSQLVLKANFRGLDGLYIQGWFSIEIFIKTFDN